MTEDTPCPNCEETHPWRDHSDPAVEDGGLAVGPMSGRFEHDDWDPRIDSGGRHADHPDFGKDTRGWEFWLLFVPWAVFMLGAPLLMVVDLIVDLPFVGYGR